VGCFLVGLLERLRLVPRFELFGFLSGEWDFGVVDGFLGDEEAEAATVCSLASKAAARSASLRHFLSIRAASSAALFSAFSRLRSEELRIGAAEEVSVISVRVSLRSL
jgi:hypothetical protein